MGANVGHYTARMARPVGPSGRVFAFEPVPETFAVLTSKLSSIGVRNVTLMNCAVSSEANMVAMAVPYFSTGLKNYYEAKIDDSALGPPIYSLRLDALQLPAEVSLIKIDVEGHEMLALSGMLELIERDRPRLIIEDAVREIREQLEEMGYEHEHFPGSPNRVFTYVGRR